MKKIIPLLAGALSTALSACSAPVEPVASAADIAAQTLIIDTHIDVPYRLFKAPADVSQATADGDFDVPRARAGGLNAPFMSIYIPASVDEAGGAFNFAEQSIASVEQLARLHPDQFAVATCSDDLLVHFAQGLISLPLGMENGGPIAGRIENLRHFFDRGIRYITLTHSKSNHISDSSYDDNEAWQGLSAFGQSLIKAMNNIGMIIDVSHISDNAFWQVMEHSATPVLATHSSLRHFTPGFHRNMSDDMVRALAANGGVIQINFGSAFLHAPAQDYGKARSAAAKAYEATLSDRSDADRERALQAFAVDYAAQHPYPFATMDVVLDHIDRVVAIAGIDAVGLGSDYDGVGDSLPIGLKDVATYPDLIQGLLDRGYDRESIEKILSGNTLRVWRAVEDYATQQGYPKQCRSA